MAAEGFTALEDNGMRGRPVERAGADRQDARAAEHAMGVFVAHTIDWNEPTLTSGDPAKRDTFLKEVRESVESRSGSTRSG